MLRHQTRHSEKSTDGAGESAAVQHVAIHDDLALARRLGNNLPGALEDLIEQHGAHLQRLIHRLNGGPSSADDLMQETLLKAWKSVSSYRGEAPLRHWLTQIAVRVCRNHQRGYRRWTAHLKSFWNQRLEQPGNAASSAPANHDAIHEAMNKLPYADRELLVLYYFDEQSLSHVAAQLGVRGSTLHVRLHRSRERLKVLLQKPEEKL